MKWLVTGGCGFIGTNLVDALLSVGDDVAILDDLSREGSRQNLAWLRSRHGADWLFTEGDIRQSDLVSRLVKECRPDVIAHLAGQVAVTKSIENPRHDFEVNALGTINVLEGARLSSPTPVVLYSSTNKVYGSLCHLRCQETDTRYTLPDYPDGLDESLPVEGHSPYGCSKLAADQYMRDYHRVYGIPTVVFRHSSMYGGRQFATYDQGWVGWFCMKALEMADPDAPPFTISGDGKQVRDVLHADDLVAVYQKAVKHISQAAGGVYNVGGGSDNSLSLLELFRELEQLTGYPMRFRRLDWRPGDQRVFIANIHAARADFDWSPRVSKEKGLSRMLAWTKKMIATGMPPGSK